MSCRIAIVVVVVIVVIVVVVIIYYYYLLPLLPSSSSSSSPPSLSLPPSLRPLAHHQPSASFSTAYDVLPATIFSPSSALSTFLHHHHHYCCHRNASLELVATTTC